MEKIKVLVIGDVRGRFKQLFNRLESTNKKAGPFELCCCVGEFFGSAEQNAELNAYKNGFKNIPMPTCILGPSSPETCEFYEGIEDGEICSNLTYLGKRGLYTLSSGVKVAYLSGVEQTASGAPSEYNFNKDDIVAVKNSCLVKKSNLTDYRGVDILLTSSMPYGIIPEATDTSKLVSFLSKEIKPRYHFCSGNGKFHEPHPYRMIADQTTQLQLATRFVSLADVGNAAKEKWIYALSLTPVEMMRSVDIVQKTTNETACPYLDVNFGDCDVKVESSDNKQYFYDMESQNSQGQRKRHNEHGQKQEKRPRFQQIDQEKCWFCLSSADVEKHLVIAIGERFYLALAKGPINDYHVLIMSVTHIAAASMLSPEDWEELEKFKQALREFFADAGYVVCFTERHYKSSHLQINALGIDKGYAWKIQHAFEDKAEEFNLQMETLPSLTSAEMLPHMGPYFVAELPDGVTMITRQMKHFPLHFARDVFCSENLLNCEEKVDWKECKLTKEEEIAMVASIRQKFAKYDFTA